MKTGFLASALVLLAVGAMPQAGRSDGCMMPTDRAWKERRERALINEPDQKALVYFNKGVEQLVISPGFDGAVGDFAWVVPVPARPQVEVLKGAPFHELARLVEPVAPRRRAADASAKVMAMAQKVRVLERKEVGDYDVSVLASTDANALMTWLRTNRYHLPEKAAAPMQSYIREGWTFVACRIKSTGSAQALHAGTLTPLRLIFPVSNPIYPMRLSGANPQAFTLLNYLVIPQNIAAGRGTPSIQSLAAPGDWAGRPLYRAAMLTKAQRIAFPTLAGLSRSNLDIYVLHAKFKPGECDKDFIWNLPHATSLHADRDAPPHSPWWVNATGVMTWATLQQPEDRAYLAFASEMGSDVADRGIFCGHYGKDAEILPSAEQTAFYKQHGLKVTSFLSVEDWDPSVESATRLLNVLKTHVDRGCDGVHLDMLFQAAREENVPEMVRQMRDELHRYGQRKYSRDVLFTGNVWQLDSPIALRIGALTDVAWIESWGKNDLDLVRIARVGRSLGGYRTPVWYHLQPDKDSETRIQRLANLPKALFASCLFEGAEFLCNYKYPVPVTIQPVKPGQDRVDWQMFYINAEWRQSLKEYTAFAHRYHAYLTGTHPQSRILVAFRPEEVRQADDIMNALLAHGIDYNVLPYGEDPLRPATAEALRGYETIVTPVSHPELQSLAQGATVVTRAEDVFSTPADALKSYVRIEGGRDVLGRLFIQGGRRIVHLKQTGYTDSRDRLDPTGPMSITVYAPGVQRGFCVLPTQLSRVPLALKRQGDNVMFTLPGMTYFSLVVLE